MKITFTIITVLLNFMLLGSGCQAAGTTTAFPAASADTTHKMIHPDANTVYLDTAGKKIEVMQFMEAVKTGKFIFEPDMKNDKVISVKLKKSAQKISMGTMAPVFSGTDIEGHHIDLNALKGKTVILNFWFTTCAPCLAEIPEMNELVTKYKNDNSIVFIAITYNNADVVKAFLKNKPFKFSILPDRQDIIKQYGISGFPTSLVIDKTGNIAFLLSTYDGTNVAQLDGVIGALKNVK